MAFLSACTHLPVLHLFLHEAEFFGHFSSGSRHVPFNVVANQLPWTCAVIKRKKRWSQDKVSGVSALKDEEEHGWRCVHPVEKTEAREGVTVTRNSCERRRMSDAAHKRPGAKAEWNALRRQWGQIFQTSL